MDPFEAQQVLHSTGSFTGFHRFRELGSNYLSATSAFKQPLCGNEEGWGPLSPHRYDFTPCFIDVWIASVAVFGLLVGPIAIWSLVRKALLDKAGKLAHVCVCGGKFQLTLNA
jgi:ATP-binding cassette, subfamily C (CFTR/MRP), member 1